MSTFKQFNSECSNCTANKIVKTLHFGSGKFPLNEDEDVPFHNYRPGVHVLDHNVSTFKQVNCKGMGQCIAQLVILPGTSIVVPSSTTAQIRTNGGVVANIQCINRNGVSVPRSEFDRCNSFFQPEILYRVGYPVESDLDVGDHEDGKGIHSFRTREQAQQWASPYIKLFSNI